MPATLIDDAHVRCYSPGSLAPGPAALRLSLNAQDVAPSALTFFFEATPVVSALQPVRRGVRISLEFILDACASYPKISKVA